MTDLTRVRCVLAVQDLAASTDYYTRVLGMAVDFTAPGWTFLSQRHELDLQHAACHQI